MRCTTGTPGPPKPGHAWLSPNTSRSSTTASDCTPPSATAPPTKPSPTTTQRQQPPHDQTTEDCPRSLTRPSIDPVDAKATARFIGGVDWAKDDHAVWVLGDQGEVLDRFTVAHDAAGLKRMSVRLLRAGVEQIGIERGDGPVVEALLTAG